MNAKGNRHENYETLNLIGYGLAKFDIELVNALGFKSKKDFYEFCTMNGIGETFGTIKNRQDLFDPFFENGRKGWWQKGTAYIHRKVHIDSLFGALTSIQFADLIKFYFKENHKIIFKSQGNKPPILQSKFRQLQLTGLEAELYFMSNFDKLKIFNKGTIEDARLFGDGYDFQIEVDSEYYLAEVKGIRGDSGGIRLTENEYHKALEYKGNYILSIVCNLDDRPQLITIENPIKNLSFTERSMTNRQVNYHSELIKWI